MLSEKFHQAVHFVGDVVAPVVAVGVILKIIPVIAGLFTISWYGIGLYEKITGRPFSESRLAKWIRK